MQSKTPPNASAGIKYKYGSNYGKASTWGGLLGRLLDMHNYIFLVGFFYINYIIIYISKYLEFSFSSINKANIISL